MASENLVPESAKRHQRVRRQHSSELAQDYVEAIFNRLQAGSPVRVTDLQEDFGVSHVSVIRALRRVESQGLLHYDKEEGIELTHEGQQVAEKAFARHQLLVRFFRTLGVSERQADADAEGTEHHLSEETVQAIERFLEEK